jgi:hypothetical protein
MYAPIVNKQASGVNGLRIKQDFINQLTKNDNHPLSCDGKLNHTYGVGNDYSTISGRTSS